VSCSCRPLTTEVRFRSWMSPHEICCGQSGNGTGFSPSAAVFPCQFHSASAPHIAFIITKGRGLGTFITATGLGSVPSQSVRVCGRTSGTKTGFFSSTSVFQLSLCFHQCSIFMLLQDRWRNLGNFRESDVHSEYKISSFSLQTFS